MRYTSLALVVLVSACGSARPETTTPPTPAATAEARPLLRGTLAARRVTQLARLVAYRDAGSFTTNEVGLPIGVFRDDDGHLCAMASLIASSGQVALVDEVARTNNRLKLATVQGGPLMAWMLDSGLTQEEIAMVQGALDLDLGQFEVIEEAGAIRLARRPSRPAKMIDVAAARAEVTRRLTTALETLNAGSAHSLEVAVERRNARQPPDARSGGHRTVSRTLSADLR